MGFVPNLYATYAYNDTALSDYLNFQNRESTLKAKENLLLRWRRVLGSYVQYECDTGSKLSCDQNELGVPFGTPFLLNTNKEFTKN